MYQLLLYLFAPGEKIPPGATQVSLSYEGISWGWAFFLFVILAAITVWGYLRYAPLLPRPVRLGLTILRCFFFAIALILLVRPVLLATVEDTIRRPLLVMVDTTASMTLQDHRTAPEDLVRAAIATGALDPSAGLKQTPPNDDKLRDLSRSQMLEAIAGNGRLNLWPRLFEKSDINVFGFGRKITPLGGLVPVPETPLTPEASAAFFHGLRYEENLTAIGDSLKQLLDEQCGQPVSGILLITDGANNSGSSPVEAAAIAKQDGVPLMIYGVGVTSPRDIMVADLSGPQISSVKERLTVTARVRGQSMQGRKAVVQLKADGKVVDEEPIEFRSDDEQEINLSYTPDRVGVVELEAYVPPLPEEMQKDNNSAKTHVRIVDDKLNVLYVEQEPTWDYQYLLAMMQRDRRLKVKCVMIKGDKAPVGDPNTPYLDAIPQDKTSLYANDLVILGDVDPAAIGDARMKLLSDWVSKLGGGLIFHAGPLFDPSAYRGTPLAPLLPVEGEGKTADRYSSPVQLTLTPQGETSPLLELAQDPDENLAIWKKFPGVSWTAWVGRARPGAQVLLTDPTLARATQEGPMPVIAMQSYGLGQTLYIGTGETYRWRSKTGEKYYARLWSQMIQALTSQRTTDSSALTQLRTDRASYLTGDKVQILGRIFQHDFTPVTDAEIPGVITFTPEAKPGQPAPTGQTKELRLQTIADRPGEYRAETVMTAAGSYSFISARDPKVSAKWQIAEPRLEFADVAMNERMLRAVAEAAGGHFLREEDLIHLPDLLSSHAARSVSFKRIPLAHAPILLVLMIVLGCVEWFWRRKQELK